MIINTDEIQRLLADESVTGYRIGKETNVKQQIYDKYRKGQSSIDTMPIQTARELQLYINKKSTQSN